MFFNQIAMLEKWGVTPIFLWVCLIGVVAATVSVFFLYRFFRWLLARLFSHVGVTDENSSQALSVYTVFLTILVPVDIICSMVWLYLVEGKNVDHISGCISVTFLFIHVCTLALLAKLGFFYYACYKRNGNELHRPIKGIMVAYNLVLLSFAIAHVIASVCKERPLVVFSSMGAMFALFMFAFQNTVLSFISNALAQSSGMAKIGDWIVIDGTSVDGIVEQVGSHILKVRNWDGVIVSVPVRMLTEKIVLNYQEIFQSGARRILRSILLDQRSIQMMTDDIWKELCAAGVMNDEIRKAYETAYEHQMVTASEGRIWTNAELFCVYMENYLKHQPDILHDRFCFVQTQAPTPCGIPVGIYCFTTKTSRAEYDKVQTSLLLHMLAVLPKFHLNVFQFCGDGNAAMHAGYLSNGNTPQNPVVGASAFKPF